MSKMTDEQIKKALECCVTDDYDESCIKCPMLKHRPCDYTLHKNALDLINRQQKTIERLKEEVASKSLKYSLLEREKAENISGFVDDLKLVRTETIKGFEAKIHEKLHQAEMHGNFEPVVTREMFDSVVKEMEGEGK